MINVATCFAICVICIHNFYQISINHTKMSNSMIVVHSVWCSYNLSWVLMVISMASATTNEVNNNNNNIMMMMTV